MTQKGIAVGTPEYMSPEQIDGQPTDKKSDIYSLGVMFYEMLTGRRPFEGNSPFAIGYKHKMEVPQDPRLINPQISEDLSRCALKCLEKNREDRYQSADEALADLRRIQTQNPVERIRRAGRTRPNKLLIPMILLAAAAAAVAIVFLL
jgi:serine/threonine-protein kinase